MAKFDDYTQKNTPEDNDITLILDKTANVNKKTPFSGIWTWIVNKMTNAVIQNLQTTNKTVIGSINELNSNSRKIKFFNYYQDGVDVDEKMHDLGTDCAAFLYFGGNLINPPVNPDAWTYFSVIIIGTRAFAFSPSNHTNAFAFRQNVDGSWKEWIFV